MFLSISTPCFLCSLLLALHSPTYSFCLPVISHPLLFYSFFFLKHLCYLSISLFLCLLASVPMLSDILLSVCLVAHLYLLSLSAKNHPTLLFLFAFPFTLAPSLGLPIFSPSYSVCLPQFMVLWDQKFI